MVFRSVHFFLCSLLILVSQATSKPDYDYTCFTGEEYGPNSTYYTNLNALLSRLTSNTKIDYGFYDSSYGLDPDRVYATGLCRGDIAPYACRCCLNNSSFFLLNHCPYHGRAVAVNDQCMLRYSSHSISGYQDNSEYRVYFRNETIVTDWDQHNYALMKLLSRLRVKAATSGDSHGPNLKFAAGHAISPSFRDIYAVVQCKLDLTVAECDDCLVGGFSELPRCCRNSSGGGVVKFSCIFRYENFIFYEPMIDALTISLSPQGSPLPSPLPNASTDSTHHGKSNRSQVVIAKAVPVAASVVLLIFVCIYLRVRKSTKHFESEIVEDNEVNDVKSSQFDFDTIKIATNNFSDANKLGQGGFGPVYMGMLSNEQVAVKRLSMNSDQGDIEFENEVLLMAKLQHRNLVRLLGFCFERKERLLVYEFLPRKSLDCYLFNPIKQVHLDWKTRYKIIEGIACGLFNLMRILNKDGYMAPEYARHGKLSAKSDVFSFGVIILEIISGQKNVRFHNGENLEHLLSFAWKNWRKGLASNIIDPSLSDGSRNEIERCIHIGLLCVQEKAIDRPMVASILHMLNSPSFYLPVPMQPAFFMNDKCSSNTQFSEHNYVVLGSNVQESNSAEPSINGVLISSLYPR